MINISHKYFVIISLTSISVNYNFTTKHELNRKVLYDVVTRRKYNLSPACACVRVRFGIPQVCVNVFSVTEIGIKV